MRPLVSPEEMRRADEETIGGGLPAEVLMERAGRAVARAALRLAGGRYARRFTVVSGKGNNGGDGFVAARVLHQQGARVVCCTTFDPAQATGAAAHHLALLQTSGCPVVPFDVGHLEADVVVDAVFGTGFSGEPREAAAEVLKEMAKVARQGEGSRPSFVAVDVPSAGLIPADLTVAIAAEKEQTLLGDPAVSGEVEVVDIGIPVSQARLWVVEEQDAAGFLPRLQPDDHKTSHGSVVVVAGSDDTTGAPLLAARGAARMGSGYVTLVSTPDVIAAANVRLPDCLKVVAGSDGVLTEDALERGSAALGRADAVALGPGLGTGDEQRKLVDRALRDLDHPLVLDADALSLLAEDGDSLTRREGVTVLTPHAGEMARLLGVQVEDVVADRPGAALEAAARFDCTVVLKGRNTLVASGGRALIVTSGGPQLATAGTGDVLTGAIAALLARGGDPRELVSAACYAHGMAGSLAVARGGGPGLVAWDVAEALPDAIDELTSLVP